MTVTLKILDFGLAKATQEVAGASGLTLAGQFLGTPDYISPEQARDAATADSRSDIYSLGCTLYFMLTGAPPFTGNVLAVLRSHDSDVAMPVSKVRDDVPAELQAIITKMLAKNPEERFATARELAAALLPMATAPGKELPAIHPLVSVANRVVDTKSSKEVDTSSNPYRSPIANLSRPQTQASELISTSAPWAVRWFPAYCMFSAAISIAVLFLAISGFAALFFPEAFGATPSEPEYFWQDVLGGAMITAISLVGLGASVGGLFLRRRPSTWALGLVLLVGGTCLILPSFLGIPLAYFWLQEDTRRYFE